MNEIHPLSTPEARKKIAIEGWQDGLDHLYGKLMKIEIQHSVKLMTEPSSTAIVDIAFRYIGKGTLTINDILPKKGTFLAREDETREYRHVVAEVNRSIGDGDGDEETIREELTKFVKKFAVLLHFPIEKDDNHPTVDFFSYLHQDLFSYSDTIIMFIYSGADYVTVNRILAEIFLKLWGNSDFRIGENRVVLVLNDGLLSIWKTLLRVAEMTKQL
jgi:hypothetical protein